MAELAVAFWLGGALVDGFNIWRLYAPEGWRECVSALGAALCWPLAWCWVAWDYQGKKKIRGWRPWLRR